MLNLDPSKLLVIAVVGIIVLGPERLPRCARQVGEAWRSFSAFRQRMESEVRGSLPDLPSTTDIVRYARSPAALLDRLGAGGPADEEDPAVPGIEGNPLANAWQAPEQRSGRLRPDLKSGEAALDAEKVWLEAQARHVGDASLN